MSSQNTSTGLRKGSHGYFSASRQSSRAASSQRPDPLREIFPDGFTVTLNDSTNDSNGDEKSRTATTTDTSVQSGNTDDTAAASDQTS